MNIRRSLKLEPLSTGAPSTSSCSSKESLNGDVITPGLACLNISPAKTIDTVRVGNSASKKFIPGHRKCRSLGTNIFGKLTYHGDNVLNNQSYDFSNPRLSYTNGDSHRHQRHLLDDSVLECQHQHQHAEKPNLENKEIVCRLNESFNLTPLDHCIQGYVRRKTVQKEGRKATMASWQRYWLQIWADSLIYFAPKSFKGSERADFRREPCKVCHLDGWQAKVVGNPKHKNSFELFHVHLGTVYKFRTDSPQATQIWAHSICSAALECNKPKNTPDNLMSFE